MELCNTIFFISEIEEKEVPWHPIVCDIAAVQETEPPSGVVQQVSLQLHTHSTLYQTNAWILFRDPWYVENSRHHQNRVKVTNSKHSCEVQLPHEAFQQPDLKCQYMKQGPSFVDTDVILPP